MLLDWGLPAPVLAVAIVNVVFELRTQALVTALRCDHVIDLAQNVHVT